MSGTTPFYVCNDCNSHKVQARVWADLNTAIAPLEADENCDRFYCEACDHDGVDVRVYGGCSAEILHALLCVDSGLTDIGVKDLTHPWLRDQVVWTLQELLRAGVVSYGPGTVRGAMTYRLANP